jgi:hypothetical protein
LAGPLDDDATPTGAYVDPDTRQPLIGWDDAVDAIADDPDAGPVHTMRFGTQVDAQGVLAGSPEAEKAIGYLVKYLVKDLGDDLDHTDPRCGGVQLDDTGRPAPRRFTTPEAKAAYARRADHIDRLVAARRFEPCASRRTPARGCGRAAAARKGTGRPTSGTAAAASWSPGNGPAETCPTTSTTAPPTSWPSWAAPTNSQQPSPGRCGRLRGSTPDPPTPTSNPPNTASCAGSRPTSNAAASAGKPATAPRHPKAQHRNRFQQPTRPHPRPDTRGSDMTDVSGASSESWPIVPLWTVHDVAAYLRVPVQTLYAWRAQGSGPEARKVGKYLRYRPQDVTAWFESLDHGAA